MNLDAGTEDFFWREMNQEEERFTEAAQEFRDKYYTDTTPLTDYNDPSLAPPPNRHERRRLARLVKKSDKRGRIS
jgi:hypothetical protein